MINEEDVISENGLTSREAERRMRIYGPNEIKKKKKISPVKIFLSQFNDFIIWVLIAATILSKIMGEDADAITILVIVLMNGILGFVQEYKTEKSLEALKSLSAPTAKVVRDGRIKVINASEIVPQDIIKIESGDRVPADCILLRDENVLVDESLLTGESSGVSKSSMTKSENSNKVFMGTIVLTGNATAKAEKTGMKTEMGKIADMLQNISDEKSPLKVKLQSLGKILVVVCIMVCAAVTILGIVRGQDVYQMFLVGVTLAVAAIPEGLPAIVTVALALGVSRMLKKNALVRKLPAVETLGCTSVICSDKTGTLTENRMTVTKFLCDGNIHDADKSEMFPKLKECFVYCNDCNYNFNENSIEKCVFGDPTESALIRMFFKDGRTLKNYLHKVRKITEIPFDSDRKMMSVLIQDGDKRICYVKGAPERILSKCRYILIDNNVELLTSYYKNDIISKINEMSSKALRCIAGAYKACSHSDKNDMENDLIFIGAAGMIDPPRKNARDAVLKCRAAGIKPVMITGDHKNTAFAVGKELCIADDMSQVLTGNELDSMDNKELLKKVNKVSIFARVKPSHKLRIVKAFKKKNYIVAMTGDGVNDAPAVKEADIGISMGVSGTDVTKEASSMILLDDNFSTIVAAVEEGRVIYDNIRKFIRYLFSCNLGEVLTMLLSSIFYIETPLIPIQILLVNLATDGLPAIALGVDPPMEDIMLRKPRPKNESIFGDGLIFKIIIRGSLIGICTILSFLTAKYYNMDLNTCRTIALCTLIMSQLIHVFECRSEKHSIFEINIFSNMYLFLAVSISLLMVLGVLYIDFFRGVFHTVALNIGQWLIVIFFSASISFINSVYLFISNKKK